MKEIVFLLILGIIACATVIPVQDIYYNGEYVKGAALECAEYVMANTAPSHVTGNTAFGRFLNEDRINEFCDNCIKYLEKKLGIPAHGILSFDLKEDKNGNSVFYVIDRCEDHLHPVLNTVPVQEYAVKLIHPHT